MELGKRMCKIIDLQKKRNSKVSNKNMAKRACKEN
jgi:hypothetical protein